jgi:hypothetical protein
MKLATLKCEDRAAHRLQQKTILFSPLATVGRCIRIGILDHIVTALPSRRYEGSALPSSQF